MRSWKSAQAAELAKARWKNKDIARVLERSEKKIVFVCYHEMIQSAVPCFEVVVNIEGLVPRDGDAPDLNL